MTAGRNGGAARPVQGAEVSASANKWSTRPRRRYNPRAMRNASQDEDVDLLDACRARAVELLRRNLTSAGVRAATPGVEAERRSYTSVFARDAAICALGMAVSGDPELERGAASAIETLAEHQARNGQIAKFVDLETREPDFWYVGCIDSTLWWLIAVDRLDRLGTHPGLSKRLGDHVERALDWLLAQEHQRFRLLQQNEASDWADIMPRSGFVLYTNALWYLVKRLFGLEHAAETRESFNRLFHPFSARPHAYRRGRLLAEFPLHGARDRELYLSYVNFSSFGDEGDVFGNVLAILCGAADCVRETIDALRAAKVHEPYPARAVVRPIERTSAAWRPYMARHGQNLAWQYHNGGVWPMIGGFYIAALARAGYRETAAADLLALARACALDGWSFAEWLHGRTSETRGMAGQSWNAAAYLLAEHIVRGGADPLDVDAAPGARVGAAAALA